MTKKLTSEFNTRTQPMRKHRIFNNWNVVTKGWYIACRSKDLGKDKVLSIDLNGQKLVLWRTKDGVACTDGFCPHMGVDLAIGKVVDEKLQCFFHHWQFDKEAKCVHIPCGEDPPKNLKFNSYATREKYGHIWVWPESQTDEEVLDIPGLENCDLIYSFDKTYERSCHYHITMINGIDPQHLRTVHNISIDMDIDIDETKSNHIEFTLSGKFPTATLQERMGKFLLGEEYSYSMKYADGCLAALTMLKGAKLFNRFTLPELKMIFAYSLIEEGRILVRPIFVNKRSTGLFAPFSNFLKLFMTKRFFKMLQGEDGMVYENIRFNSTSFLKLDAPVVKYIGYLNKLEDSIWSQTKSGE
ncbi:putative oxidase [Halobacteriovorax marinus SJ]|uniref:Oxidase n=1 Tax=Halobacteriovorax marinus (strain ATCC BAA-682 / DSM 15412 / SJ) TaxID=862908 RepID=E1X1W9_HALMS|nr:aromatic ring-hydroxylating dioxygenase subunit alpha [Halobacteriovorax marinus]CBW26629.1 putative oxidase [Halobacteriovorax marinus SJ]